MKSKPLEVVGAVIRGEVGGEPAVLAFRRSSHKAAGGFWEFPGGKVEDDETPEAALAREIREELGLQACVGQLVERATTLVGDRPIDLACYWVTVDTNPNESSDHDVIQWVRAHELRTLRWAEPDLPTISILETQLKMGGGTSSDACTQ